MGNQIGPLAHLTEGLLPAEDGEAASGLRKEKARSWDNILQWCCCFGDARRLFLDTGVTLVQRILGTDAAVGDLANCHVLRLALFALLAAFAFAYWFYHWFRSGASKLDANEEWLNGDAIMLVAIAFVLLMRYDLSLADQKQKQEIHQREQREQMQRQHEERMEEGRRQSEEHMKAQQEQHEAHLQVLAATQELVGTNVTDWTERLGSLLSEDKREREDARADRQRALEERETSKQERAIDRQRAEGLLRSQVRAALVINQEFDPRTGMLAGGWANTVRQIMGTGFDPLLLTEPAADGGHRLLLTQTTPMSVEVIAAPGPATDTP